MKRWLGYLHELCCTIKVTLLLESELSASHEAERAAGTETDSESHLLIHDLCNDVRERYIIMLVR